MVSAAVRDGVLHVGGVVQQVVDGVAVARQVAPGSPSRPRAVVASMPRVGKRTVAKPPVWVIDVVFESRQ